MHRRGLFTGMRPSHISCALGAILLFATSAPARATVIVPLDLASLVQRADTIVRGTAMATTASLSDDKKQIHSVTVVRVAAIMKGAPAAEIEVRTPGGTLGDLTQVVHGAPQLHAGQEVYLFLHRVSGNRFIVEGFTQGKFEVAADTDGSRRVSQNLREVGVLGRDGVVRPGEAEGCSEREFLARLRDALEGKVTP